MASKRRAASWILLGLVGALILLGAMASILVAYGGGPESFGGRSLADVAAGDDALAALLRARRATAASWAAAYGVLYLAVVLVPYRRGEVWAWWAILAATLLGAALVLLRVPILGVRLGAGTSLAQAGIVVFALLLDAGRLRGDRGISPP